VSGDEVVIGNYLPVYMAPLSKYGALIIIKLAVDMKFPIHIHIHIHRFFVDIHGYIQYQPIWLGLRRCAFTCVG